MIRLLWLLLPISACATHDVVRSEALVKRGVCGGHKVAVFGYPGDNASCDATVFNLGEGCYAATVPDEPRRPRQILHHGATDTVWAPHLFECSASAPDGHVACVEDVTGRRDEIFGEDIVRWTYLIRLPYVSRTTVVTPYRCRERLRAWELANLPPPDRGDLVISRWFTKQHGWTGIDENLPSVRMRIEEDPIALQRILAGHELITATVCPAATGLSVTIDHEFPVRFEQELATMITRGLSEGHRAVAECTIFQLIVSFARLPNT
jgi:hypothetical protein